MSKIYVNDTYDNFVPSKKIQESAGLSRHLRLHYVLQICYAMKFPLFNVAFLSVKVYVQAKNIKISNKRRT